jgi:lantibiotic modifying enzyme
MFPEEQFLEAAADAAEVVWNQGLLKRVGICHGISGNGYTFLSLYRLTKKKEYLYRAKALACFLLDRAIKLIAKASCTVVMSHIRYLKARLEWHICF